MSAAILSDDEDGYVELGADTPHTFWNCEACGAQNSCLDGECQYCTAAVVSCERCTRVVTCEEIPFHGYSLWLCERCAAAAYHSEEAV